MNEKLGSRRLQEALKIVASTQKKDWQDVLTEIRGKIDFECPLCRSRRLLSGDNPIAGANWYYCSCGVKFVDPQRFTRATPGELGEAENGCFVCGCNKTADLYALPEFLNASITKIGEYCIHCSVILSWDQF